MDIIVVTHTKKQTAILKLISIHCDLHFCLCKLRSIYLCVFCYCYYYYMYLINARIMDHIILYSAIYVYSLRHQ